MPTIPTGEYENLNTITLYNTLQFNKIDTTIFASKQARDDYFDDVVDQIDLTEFTDLYEGREIVLPYNYLALKKYNTMKLVYNDGLGNTVEYICNVDNYQYVSTNACTPIYRIDYWLTYSYLLYNKPITMITDRRTVKEDNITKWMKADEMTVPKLSYTPLHMSKYNPSHCYIIFLNNVTGGIGKKGVTTTMNLLIGNNGTINKYVTIDKHTIGTYILVTNDATFSSRMAVEPSEYIEKIIESDFDPIQFMSFTDYTSYNTNGYVYITQDVVKPYGDLSFGYQGGGDDIKKIINRMPYYGYVVQGNEYDPYYFDNDDIPTDSTVINPSDENMAGFQVYNNFGYTFLVPIGYKSEPISYDYMINWQSGRNFSYTSDYINTLAYKEIVESNQQVLLYTNKNASLNLNYNNAIANNNNQQLDISKKQADISYEGQINSLNTQVSNTKAESAGGFIGGLITAAGMAATGNLMGAVAALFGMGIKSAVNVNNVSLLNSQATDLNIQKNLSGVTIDLQKQASDVSNKFQCDTIALARDNTIANISISNKFNNAKPNAYNQTDFTKYTSTLYLIGIDNDNGTDYTQYENIVNHYNVEGIFVGQMENWLPNVNEGLYFNYVKGSVLDNSNRLSNEIDYDIYLQLIQRIENGIRIWHNKQWFGNLTIDNTFEGTPEPYNEFTTAEKRVLENWVLTYIWDNIKTEVDTIINSSAKTTTEKTYCLWYNENLYWGVNPPTQDRIDFIESYVDLLIQFSTEAQVINYLKSNDSLTIYEVQYGISYLETL